MNKIKFTKKEAQQIINNIAKEMHISNTNITISYNKNSRNSLTLPNKNQYDIIIGTQDINPKIPFATINLESIIKVTKACFHETHHVKQYSDLFLNNNSNYPNINKIAKSALISNTVSEYYYGGYHKQPFEIDAEMHALQDTLKYFESADTGIPMEEIEKALINSINYEPEWYGKTPIESIDDAFESLNTRLNNKNITFGLCPLPQKNIPENPTEIGAYILKNKNFEYCCLNTQDEQFNFMIELIKERNPEAFVKYPCLKSEYPEMYPQEQKKSIDFDTRLTKANTLTQNIDWSDDIDNTFHK